MPWGSEGTRALLGNVGLITSRDKNGQANIMAAEWTNQVSYSPAVFEINIGKGKKTLANILETEFFGISIASVTQNNISHISGTPSIKLDKIKALKELGVEFEEDKETKVLTVVGSSLRLVAKIINHKEAGDHEMVMAEIVKLVEATDKEPLIYFRGKYWEIGVQLAHG